MGVSFTGVLGKSIGHRWAAKLLAEEACDIYRMFRVNVILWVATNERMAASSDAVSATRRMAAGLDLIDLFSTRSIRSRRSERSRRFNASKSSPRLSQSIDATNSVVLGHERQGSTDGRTDNTH